MGKKTWIWITVACGFLFVLLVGGVIVGAVMIGASSSGMAANNDWEETIVKKGGSDRILMLNVDGMIMSGMEGAALGPVGTSSDEIREKLNQAMQDDSLRGIVVRVNSPGGDVVASDEIYEKLMEVRKKAKLPVVFSFGSTAASGGYYIATAADKIFTNPLTITGSIGVIMSSYNYSELADKVGVKEVIIKSGDLKDMGSATREMTEEERDVLQTMVNESYDRFVEVIATGRDITKEKVREIGDGRVYTGKQAKDLNLVDEFGTVEDAIKETEKMAGIKNATVVSYSETFNFSSLFGMTANKLSGIGQPLSVSDLLEFRAPGLMYLYTTD